jgi:RNA methyltransferase, TrmH family
MTSVQPASQSQLQTLRRLIGRREARLEAGVCVVESAKVLREALAAGAEIEAVFVREDSEAVVPLGVSAPVRSVELSVFDRLADTETPQPLLAVVRVQRRSIESIHGGTILVGVDIRDPGNAGTMIRSAELSGASAVVFLGTSVDVTSPKVVRSSAGGMFHLPVVQCVDTALGLDELRRHGCRVLGTAVHRDAVPYCNDGTLAGDVVIVVGNEAHGLDQFVEPLVDQWITIPMQGRTESLNVGMAASVLCFEAARQRSSE